MTRRRSESRPAPDSDAINGTGRSQPACCPYEVSVTQCGSSSSALGLTHDGPGGDVDTPHAPWMALLGSHVGSADPLEACLVGPAEAVGHELSLGVVAPVVKAIRENLPGTPFHPGDSAAQTSRERWTTTRAS